ncbi:hypothetical protein LTR08_001388 [Meristemomyces frigidus]|nr:hypothetical protein LTR08_001388 [Meristemomyces frigidus]
MPLTVPSTTPPEAPAVNCEHCDSSLKQQPVDGTKLNALLDDVKGRLSSDVYGNWFIEGGKLANDARHGSLGLVFNLVSELEAVKGIMDKQASTHLDVPATGAKRGGKRGSSVLNIIRSEVEQQLSTPMNDLKLRCERLEAEVQKVKKEKSALEKTQFDDGQRIKNISTRVKKMSNAPERRVPLVRFATVQLGNYPGWSQVKKELLQIGMAGVQCASSHWLSCSRLWLLWKRELVRSFLSWEDTWSAHQSSL